MYPPLKTLNELIEDTRQRMDKDANSGQIGGDHYKNKAIQPWDYILSNDLGYLEGNIVKYVSRWKLKNGVQDLHKAKHYLQKLIEVSEVNEK